MDFELCDNGIDDNCDDATDEMPCTVGLRAVRALHPVLLDGLPDDPTYAAAVPVTFVDQSGASNNSVTVWALWDSENLYLTYDVTDSSLETDGDSFWQDDGIEFFLDILSDGGSQHEDDIHLVLSTEALPLPLTIDSGTPWVSITDAWSGAWSRKNTSSGYVIELRYPWADLDVGSAPEPGYVIGLLLINNDRDDGEIVPFDWQGLDSGAPRWDADNWGVLLLDSPADCLDEDGDGYGDPAAGCAFFEVDCDDASPMVNSDATELCNAVDDDCDGRVDEDFDLQIDIQNCGACGNRCAANEHCEDGVCRPLGDEPASPSGGCGSCAQTSIGGDWLLGLLLLGMLLMWNYLRRSNRLSRFD